MHSRDSVSVNERGKWEIWHQDTFDRESPRRVEVNGRGLEAGLIELWTRHLSEAVRANGGKGFSRFNLWLKREGKSIRVIGEWEGQVRLRGWVYGDQKRDRLLLKRIAAKHKRYVLRGETSAEILAEAKASGSREDFEKWLLTDKERFLC